MTLTNKEKFIEIFDYAPDKNTCPVYCGGTTCIKSCPNHNTNACKIGDWWELDYEGKKGE